MTLRFNRLVRPDAGDIFLTENAAGFIESSHYRMVFMSHKHGDRDAEREATRIAVRFRIMVYMAEWDNHVSGDNAELPNYIMHHIGVSRGFLVYVSAEIGESMWVGYEIGGAHAYEKSRARIVRNYYGSLPSVVEVLHPLTTEQAVDQWIVYHVL